MAPPTRSTRIQRSIPLFSAQGAKKTKSPDKYIVRAFFFDIIKEMERPSEHIEIENIVEQERDPMLTHLAEYEKLFLGARSVQQALARTLAERGE